MDERLARMEEALEELRAENRQLRHDLNQLHKELLEHTAAAIVAEGKETDEVIRSRIKGRWVYTVVTTILVVVPVVLLTMSHLNALWSTVIGTINALIVYFLGPAVLRLLFEGLIRAIPTVLLGQTARIGIDKWRKKKAR